MSFTVGFDLDMTLIDPRPGLIELFGVLAEETSIPLDGPAFATRLGPPLVEEFARYGLDQATIDHLVIRYRALYGAIVIPRTTAMAGAAAAVRAVADRGGRSVVISAKRGDHVAAHLRALDIEVAAVAGGLWSTAKAGALIEHGAEVYVGDHLGDIAGARAADALAIGVATGPVSVAELKAGGADAVLKSLTEFPGWLDSYLLATVH